MGLEMSPGPGCSGERIAPDANSNESIIYSNALQVHWSRLF